MEKLADSLPDDAEALQRLVRDLLAENVRQRREIKQQRASIDHLEQLLRLYRKQRFGASSEKLSPNQLLLFNEAEVAEAEPDALEGAAEAPVDVGGHSRRRGKRSPLPPELPRVRIEHDLPEHEKVCPKSGLPLHRIGEEVSEQLEIIPAKVQVIQHTRIKYGCRCCGEVLKTATMPPQPIPKSMASPSLLAQIAIAKYADGLPLNRQEAILGRIGLDVPRCTLAQWMIKVAELLLPIQNLMRDVLLEGPVIYMDETTVQVLKAVGKKPTSPCYMWARVRAGPGPRIVDFEFDRSRSAAVPGRLLAGFQGTLVTDGYEAYNRHCKDHPEVVHGGDWVHVRRKFDEARKGKPDPKKATTANEALAYIARLFRIERDIEGGSTDERFTERQAKALPLVQEIRTWLDVALTRLPPKTLTGKALSYMDTEWSKLLVYLGDGRVEAHNNFAENAIRPFCVGRRAWLFSDSERGATASATIYSVIETAKANGLEPHAYLTRLLTDLPKAQSLADYEALLPWRRDEA